jgi:dTDP-glucose 4,6-dehydratase
MTARFLVIGSNSFSGACFVKSLLERGHDVTGVSRSAEPDPVFLPYRWRDTPGAFEFRRIDLNHQLVELLEVIDDQRPPFVVNFAAQGMVAESWHTPEHWYQTNVVAQVKLHDQLRKRSFIEKYVHVTTPEAYGSTEGWIKENFHFAPSTPYAVSRAACDLHLTSFFRAYSFPVCFTRAANVYGPGQQLYRIIPKAMISARTGTTMQLHGGGHSIRSFIHMSDVADATYRIATSVVPGQSYHISTTDTVSIRQLVEKICAITGTPFEALAQVSGERLGKDQAYLLDSGKLREELGWTPTISLDAGLADTLAWLDSNLDVLKTLPQSYIHKP